MESQLFWLSDGLRRRTDADLADQGILTFPYELNGVDCSLCGSGAGSPTVLPMTCPSAIKKDILSLKRGGPLLTAAHFARILARWQELLRSTHPSFVVAPGNKFATAVWHRLDLPTADFYWPSIEPICSKRVEFELFNSKFTGVTFGELSTRLDLELDHDNECGEARLPSDEVPYDESTEVIDNSYSLMIVTSNSADKVLAEFGGHRCPECNSRRPESRSLDLKRAGGIAKSKMRLPRRWVEDTDVFTTYPFGVLVTSRVWAVLERMNLTGAQARKIIIED